jgi:hypothetical protein
MVLKIACDLGFWGQLTRISSAPSFVCYTVDKSIYPGVFSAMANSYTISSSVALLCSAAQRVFSDGFMAAPQTSVVVVGDVVHDTSGYCGETRAYADERNAGKSVDHWELLVSLDDLVDGNLCQRCWFGYRFTREVLPSWTASGRPWLCASFCGVRVSETNKLLDGYFSYHAKHGHFRSAKATGDQLNKARKLLERVKKLFSGGAVPDELAVMVDSLEDLVVKLAAKTSGDGSFVAAQRGAVYSRVIKALVPSWYTGPDLVVDEHPVLMGISPAPSVYAASSAGAAVLKEMTLSRCDSALVLAVPRFVADFLNGCGGWKRSAPLRGSLVQIVAVDDTPRDVIEVAASIWDPHSGSALADLAQALDTATVLDVQSKSRELDSAHGNSDLVGVGQ